MPATVAKARLDALEQAGLDKITFAWAGADKPGIGHYYVVQGPTFVIEFVNTQPDSAGNPANHIHSLWRDTTRRFWNRRRVSHTQIVNRRSVATGEDRSSLFDFAMAHLDRVLGLDLPGR